jgi:hypothetical protein
MKKCVIIENNISPIAEAEGKKLLKNWNCELKSHLEDKCMSTRGAAFMLTVLARLTL